MQTDPATVHPIFQEYPLSVTKVATSSGDQPTPYHVYDGHAVLIGGSADYSRVQALLVDEQVVPIRTQSGRALMALWAVDETQASHGAHTELQVSFYAARNEIAPVADTPFAILKSLLTEPDVRQMCHGLWNNTAQVVAYNREILGLTPRLARSEFSTDNGRVQFAFYAADDDRLLVQGDVHEERRPSLAATIALFRSFGLREALRAASLKRVELKVVNPVSDVVRRNADARTISASDSIVAQLFDPRRDRIEIHDRVYAALDFEPHFVEHMRGFKMVYLNPE